MDPDKRNARTCWAAAEDAALRRAVARLGAQKWAAVADEPGLEGRPPKSCRLRWLNHLAPAVKKDRFRESETRAVALGYVRHGPRWAHIAREISGRTDSAIKNHWNNHLRQRYVRTLNDVLETPMVSDIRAAAAFGVGPEMLKKSIFSHSSKSTELGGKHGKAELQNDETDNNGTETMENKGAENMENNGTENNETENTEINGMENIEKDGNNDAEIYDLLDTLCTDPNFGLTENRDSLANVSKDFPSKDEIRVETSGVQGEIYRRNDKKSTFLSGTVDQISSIFENDITKTSQPLRSWGDSNFFGFRNLSDGTPFSKNSSFRLPNKVETVFSEEELYQLHCATSSCPDLVTSGSISSSGTILCPQASIDSIKSRSVNASDGDMDYLNNVDTTSLNTLESLFLPRIRQNFDLPRNRIGQNTSESSNFPLMKTEKQILHTETGLGCNTYGNWVMGNSYNNSINNNNQSINNNNHNDNNSIIAKISNINNTNDSNDRYNYTVGNNNEDNNVNRENRIVFDNGNETGLLNSCVPCFRNPNNHILDFESIYANLLELPSQNLYKHPIPERFGTDSYTINSVENEGKDWTLTDTVRRVFGSSPEIARQVFESW